MRLNRSNIRVLLLGVLASMVLIYSCSDDDNPSGPGGGNTRPHFKEVSIQGNAFVPATLTIAAGDTVRWTNNDNTGHTVTSNTGSELNSAILANDQTYQHIFGTAGAFAYHCTVHPAMQGVVTVE